jgi:hypothetical protein
MKHDNLRKYLTGFIVGFVMGVLVLHPFSMVFQNLVHPMIGLEVERVTKAFNIHHLPMAAFFGLLGAVVGAVVIFFQKVISRERHRVKVLEGLLPICSYCKKIRDDTGVEKGQGTWQEIDRYIATHTEADFTHGICQECYEKYVKKELEEVK